MLYFELNKNNKIAQNDKIKFSMHRGQNLDLSFLLIPKYIIFRSKKLHTDKNTTLSTPWYFFRFFEKI
jgi:hypothetical protein